MIRFNDVKMSAIEVARKKRSDELQRIISSPFDLNNKDQIKDLRKYLDEFECTVNQMYLFQFMGDLYKVWGGVRGLQVWIPIPEYVTYFTNGCFYLSVMGMVLGRFSMTDFYEQLLEMKTLYNWALKDGKDNYNAEINNIDKLMNPDIQQLMRLIAPLCSVDFMMVWPKKITMSQEGSGLFSTITSSISYFTTPKPSIGLLQAQSLQADIEKRALDLGVFKAFQQAIGYFVTNPRFKELMMVKIAPALELLKKINVTTTAVVPALSKQE